MVIQGYDRINWEDFPSQNTPINAENLNHMEDGIENLYAAIGDIDLDAIAADIAEVKEEVENFQPGVELTQEEYDDLTEEEKNNGTIYYIKDGDASAITAADAHYDNSTSGLTATNVQSAVDEVQGEIDELNSNRLLTKTVDLTNQQLGSSWSQTSKNLGKAIDLFGISADKIVSCIMTEAEFTPSANSMIGFYNGYVWAAASQSSTLSSGGKFKIVYTL